jgi:RecA/RadA recombinase
MAKKIEAVTVAYKHDISDLLDATEKKFRITTVGMDIEARRTSAMDTGILSLNLMTHGGLIPGLWVTVYGGEGSAKSTTLQTMMASFSGLGVKGSVWDYEGSTDPVYTSRVVERISALKGKQITLSELFGVQDPKTGKWKVKPIFRLYTESIGDAMFDAMSSLARVLPDKVFAQGKWWYVFDEKPAGQKINQGLSSRGSYYVQARDGFAEMVIFADSYPQMYPEKLDEDGKGAGMAAVARMFSENIPKLAGKLKKKGILVVGVNQLRLRPGVTHGNPEYEPAGEAVKFASAVRINNRARSVPHGKGPVEEEASVLMEGNDQYKYILMKVTKNKSATSIGLESWQRVWAADPNGDAHGFCPAWNIYDYLVLTGQCIRFGTGKKRLIEMNLWNIDGSECVYSNPKMEFADLKALVLLPEEDRKVYAKELGMSKSDYMTYFSGSNLYQHCQQQILSGTGPQFAYAVKNGIGLEEADDGEYEEEPDEEEDEENDD